MDALQKDVASAREMPAEWHQPATLTLDEGGMIRDCSNSCEALFGYSRRELVWQHVSGLLPQLSGIRLVKNGKINPQLGFICRCGHLFRTRGRHGVFFNSELSFVKLEHAGVRILRLFVRPLDNAGC